MDLSDVIKNRVFQRKHVTVTGRILLFLLLCCFLEPARLFSQNANIDSSSLITGIEVTGVKDQPFGVGQTLERFDSTTMVMAGADDLSALLSQGSVLYVRDYGAGNLATLSLRGTSSDQSGIFWEGFELNPPGSGMMDLSLVPVFLFDKAEIRYGGSSSLYGSGSMGGGVFLSSDPGALPGTRLSAGANIGSFGERIQHARLTLQQHNWCSSTAILHLQKDNDFPYSLGDETFKRQHASVMQTGVLQSLSRTWEKDRIDFHAWWQRSDREIPASVTSANQNADRFDQSIRFAARWKHQSGKGLLSAGIASFHDDLHYTEQLSDGWFLIDSKIRNHSTQGEISYDRKLAWYDLRLTAGLDLDWQAVNVGDYGGYNEQGQAAAYLSLKKSFDKERWIIMFNLRQVWLRDFRVPVTPYLGFRGKCGPYLEWNGGVSRIYRYPSLNDLFWIPGGNRDLNPEDGWNAETGGHLTLFHTDRHQLLVNTSLFYTRIRNMITWVPASSSYWVAENAREVVIRGIDAGMEYSGRWDHFRVDLKLQLTRSSSLNTHALYSNDESKGKQLIYTPAYKTHSIIRAGLKNLILEYQHIYNGKVFITRDNSQYVPAYIVGNALLRWDGFHKNKYGCSLQLKLENCWDASYQVVKYYPMPGRSVQLGVTLHFQSQH